MTSNRKVYSGWQIHLPPIGHLADVSVDGADLLSLFRSIIATTVTLYWLSVLSCFLLLTYSPYSNQVE